MKRNKKTNELLCSSQSYVIFFTYLKILLKKTKSSMLTSEFAAPLGGKRNCDKYI